MPSCLAAVLGALEVARADGDHLGMGRALDAGDDLFDADIGRADDAPAELARACAMNSPPKCGGRARAAARMYPATMPQMARGLPSPGRGAGKPDLSGPKAGLAGAGPAVAIVRPLSRRPRPFVRRGARVVDRGGLENRCTLAGYRGFESHPLRHFSSHIGKCAGIKRKERFQIECGPGLWPRARPRARLGLLREQDASDHPKSMVAGSLLEDTVGKKSEDINAGTSPSPMAPFGRTGSA